MKLKILFPIAVFLLVSNLSHAEEIWSLEEEKPTARESAPAPSKADVNSQKSKSQPRKGSATTNLPSEILSRNLSRMESTSALVVLPAQNLKSILQGLNVGETLSAKIIHSVIAFPDEKAPIIAIIQDGKLKGWRLVGESSLEKNSKRIFITFKTIAKDGKSFKFNGSGLTASGQPGFEGEYYSQEATYFAGDFISSLTAAYFDGLVPRQTNVFGQMQTDNSVDSAFKKGLAGGALATAERFREKLKRVPQFSELDGPINLQVLVLERAQEI